MKTKNYPQKAFIVILILIGAFSYGQNVQKKEHISIQDKENTFINASELQLRLSDDQNSNNFHSKSINDITLLSQDFSSTTFPPTGWTVSVVTGTLGWTRGVGSQTYATFNPTGTTAANGYAFVNSDGNNGSGGPEHTILRTPAINCLTNNNVWLKFNNYFYQFGASTGDVEVSNNGTAWTTVHSSHTGLGQNQATPNPQFIDVNISSVAANQATVYVRFKWTGNYDYYWFVDDVIVYSKDAYNVGLDSAQNPNEFTVVPLVHYNNQPIALSARARNYGGSTVNNVKVKFNVYDGNSNALIHTVQSTPAALLAPGTTVNLTAPAFTIPVDTGFYITEYIVSMTQQDSDPSNDTLVRALWITDSIYARDDAVFTGQLDGSLGISATGVAIMGQNYTLSTNDKLSRVSFYLTGQSIGDTTQAYVYTINPDGSPNTLFAQTPLHIFTVDSPGWLTLQFTGGPLNLNAGTYFIGIKDFYNTDNIGLGYTNNNFTTSKSWVKVNDDAWSTSEALGFPVSYVIRPYFVCAGFVPAVISGYNTGYCQGSNVNLVAAPGGMSYLWSPSGGTTATATVNSPGSYTVSVTNAYGCPGVSSPITVYEIPKPVINLGNDTTVCGSHILNAGGPFAAYSWAGGTSTNQYLLASASGQYFVVVTDSNGCVAVDSITLTVNPLPSSALVNQLTICDYETAILDAGAGFTSYLWNNQATTQTITVAGSSVGVGTHIYWVNIGDANNCHNIDTVLLTVSTCTGVDNFSEADFGMYPNPTRHFINLVLPSHFEGKTLIQISDLSGRIVYNESTELHNINLNIKYLSAGVYNVKLINARSSFVKKLMIE
ncbi:MAG: T9SS type A sorting domain-containing protein [Bacteroidales bacterium]|nr:T9SS type A sorting domain-containing protein [Bacteroidales bacterium]